MDDVMNNVECVIKPDVNLRKIHSCSRNVRGLSFYVLKDIRGISKSIKSHRWY